VNEIQKEKLVKGLLYMAVGLSIVILPIIVVWVTGNGAGRWV
jgi:hypothetical protein